MLGVALARSGKAIAILGDGAMLMQNEINTAATYGIDAVWIVLNDARYGMIEQGMQSIAWQPFETGWRRKTFFVHSVAGEVPASLEKRRLPAFNQLVVAAKAQGLLDATGPGAARAATFANHPA